MIDFEDIKKLMQENNIVIDGFADIKSNISIEASGFDSLDLTMLLFEINRKYEMDLQINKTNTFDDIIHEINSKSVK